MQKCNASIAFREPFNLSSLFFYGAWKNNFMNTVFPINTGIIIMISNGWKYLIWLEFLQWWHLSGDLKMKDSEYWTTPQYWASHFCNHTNAQWRLTKWINQSLQGGAPMQSLKLLEGSITRTLINSQHSLAYKKCNQFLLCKNGTWQANNKKMLHA